MGSMIHLQSSCVDIIRTFFFKFIFLLFFVWMYEGWINPTNLVKLIQTDPKNGLD